MNSSSRDFPHEFQKKIFVSRYKNFALGTRERVEVLAEASCCVETMTLRWEFNFNKKNPGDILY